MYQVNTLEVCASGMERLRNQDEFILVATIDSTTTAAELCEQWLADIQAVMREDDFDYDAANKAVTEYADSLAHNVFTKPDPYHLEDEVYEYETDTTEPIAALLYLSEQVDYQPVSDQSDNMED